MDTDTSAARRAAIRAARNAFAAEQARAEAAEQAAEIRAIRQQRALAAEVPSPELRAALGMERAA